MYSMFLMKTPRAGEFISREYMERERFYSIFAKASCVIRETIASGNHRQNGPIAPILICLTIIVNKISVPAFV